MTAIRMPTPLVTTDWLSRHVDEPDLVVVDASWYLAAMQRDPRAEYTEGHIRGAVFWDLDALSDQHSPLPHMLPESPALGRGIAALGIGDADRVVVYDGSGVNLSAPRVWWTLLAAGHDQVAVLDGGLGAWRSEGRPLEPGAVRRPAARFTVRFRPELVRSQAQVREAAAESIQVLDARARGRFEGTEPEPRPGLRAGHAPGARNLPFTEILAPDGRVLPLQELRRRYTNAGIVLDRPIVTTCGSGVTACTLALGLHLLGHRAYSVYDGSWSEWGRPDGPPVEQGPARTG